MPRARSRFILAAALAAACSPSTFVWSEAPSAELDAYLASFANACGQDFDRHASYDEMLEAIAGARVVWIGDHHESERLHAAQRELLEKLHERGVPCVMLLEAIGTQDDPEVHRFLRGESSFAELRAVIAARWSDSWLDAESLDAAFYRDLLTLAKEWQVTVLGLEPTPRPPLRDRDAAMANVVRAAANSFPDRVVIVVVGQAHLVGTGDLVARTGLPHVALGGVPPARLRAAGRRSESDERSLWRSTGGLWWFDEMLEAASAR